MSSPRPTRLPAIGLLSVLLVAVFAPLLDPGAAQVNPYCPGGDSGQSPPGTPRDVFDMTIGDSTMVLTPTDASAEVPGDERGAYTVVPGAGKLNVTVAVDEVGGDDSSADRTVLRATLGKPDGTTVTQNANIAVPGAGANTTHTFRFDIGSGRHTILFHINPNQDPAEECTDGIPNSNCPGTQGCTQTYYDNNRRTVGVIAGDLPDLRLQGVSQNGPERATPEAHEDSEAKFTISVTNAGDSTAFNLSALNPGAAPMTIKVAVRDCDCDPQTVDIGQISAGTTKSVTTDTFTVHGLTDDIVLDISLDPNDWVAETNETNNLLERILPLPTPDLVTAATASLPVEGDAYVTPQGRDLTFSVSVTNEGLGVARTTEDTPFRLTVHKDDDDANPLLDQNVSLEGLGSAAFTITVPADNITGSHTFTVSADPDDEVYESSDANNEAELDIVVAVYDATLSVKAADRRTTVPPGVTGNIPFTLKNTGTVTDTFDFSAPFGERDRQRFLNADSDPVTSITLAPGASFAGEAAYDLRPTDAEGTEFNTTITATSRIVHTRHTQNVTYVVGPDTVAPDITLEAPTTGYLAGNEIIVRIRDNVAVTEAESDLGTDGQFASISPNTEDGILYTLSTDGLPQEFSFRIRATDAAGNTETEQISIIRDRTAPRITNHRFTPATGAGPGDTVALLVEASDANMERVEASVWQKRPGLDHKQNFTLQFGGGRWQLREWVVPDRPGYYQFNITAYDRAGNEDTTQARYTVNGLNLRIITDRPTVSPREPNEGDRIIFTYVVENTSPRFDTGPFIITFNLDRQTQTGLRDVRNLEPGGRMTVQFGWIATPGPHSWALVVDQANQVFEDDETQADNVLEATSANMFRDQALFAPADEDIGLSGFGQRVEEYWFVPTLLLGVAVMFTIAFVLGRRPAV